MLCKIGAFIFLCRFLCIIRLIQSTLFLLQLVIIQSGLILNKTFQTSNDKKQNMHIDLYDYLQQCFNTELICWHFLDFSSRSLHCPFHMYIVKYYSMPWLFFYIHHIFRRLIPITTRYRVITEASL